MTLTSNGTATAVYDIDEARAARSEVATAPFPFRMAGEDFAMHSVNTWTLKSQLDLIEGRLPEAFDAILVGGAATFARLLDLGVDVLDLQQLCNAASTSAGLGSLPNFSAQSPPASTPT